MKNSLVVTAETIPRASAEHDEVAPGIAVKVLYGVGDFANSIKMVIFGLFLFFFYTSVMGLPGTLAGIGAAIGLVWDAAIDPFIGQFSDRFRSRFGRRHALMFVGAGSLGVTFWLLFSPPQGISVPALFLWFLIASLLARLASSVFLVPYYALGAELSADYNQRTSIASIRAVCGLVGAVAAASLSFVIFFPEISSGQDPKLNYEGYPPMGLALGMVMTIGALLATVATLKWRSQSGHQIEPARTLPTTGFYRGFRVALGNRSFRVLFTSFALIFLGIVINSALAIHFYTHFVEITSSATLSVTLGSFYVGAVIGALFWSRFAKYWEKRSIYLVATIVTATMMVAAYFLIGPGRVFGTGDARPLILGQLGIGFFASAFWILPASMVADVADEDETVTNQRREGTFFGILNFGQQLAAGASTIVAGVGLDFFARFDGDLTIQSPGTIERIGILFTIVPAVFLLAGAYAIRRYSLMQHEVAAIQDEIKRRRRRLPSDH